MHEDAQPPRAPRRTVPGAAPAPGGPAGAVVHELPEWMRTGMEKFVHIAEFASKLPAKVPYGPHHHISWPLALKGVKAQLDVPLPTNGDPDPTIDDICFKLGDEY